MRHVLVDWFVFMGVMALASTGSRIGKLALIGVVALAAASASAQITKQGNGYLLRMKYTQGTTMKYQVASTIDMQGMPIQTNQVISMKVLRVANGVATIQASMSNPTITGSGKTTSQPMPGQTKSQTVQMDSLGNLVGGGGPMQQIGIALPPKPISVGATWASRNPVPVTGGKTMQIMQTYKFLGMDKLGRQQTAKVASTMKGTGGARLSGTSTIWLSAADGSVVKMVTSMTAMGYPVKATMTRK